MSVRLLPWCLPVVTVISLTAPLTRATVPLNVSVTPDRAVLGFSVGAVSKIRAMSSSLEMG